MVFNAMVTLLLGLVQTILTPLPSVPATPDAITNGASWVSSTIGSVIGVIDWVFSTPLVVASVAIIVGVFTFEWGYKTVLWIVHKLPFLNIH